MKSKGADNNNLNFSSEQPQFDKAEAERMTASLLKESDRGCVIFGAAYLSDALEKLLRGFFRNDEETIKKVVDPLFNTYAPLATFASRIDMAYSMQIITKEVWVKLHIIRKLRNQFAHESGPVDFEAPSCKDLLRQLIGSERTQIQDSERSMFGHQMLTKEEMVRRLAFGLVVSNLLGRIDFLCSTNLRTLYLTQEEIKEKRVTR